MRWAGGCGLAVWSAMLLACGSDAVEDANRRAMQGPQPARDAAAGSAPEIHSLALLPQRPAAGEPLRAVVEASDPDGDPVSLGYAWSVNGERLRGGGPTLSPARTRKGDEIEVRVIASDGRLESPSRRASARVVNRPPRLKGLHIEPAGGVGAGRPISVRPVAEDPDGDALDYVYRWRVNGSPLDASGAVLDTSGLRRGDRVQVGVRASDGEDETAALESPEIEILNAPPVIVSRPEPEAGEVFRYAVVAQDPDGDRGFRFELVEAPEGMRVDEVAGVVEWRPSADQQGRFSVEVAVRDGRGGRASQRFELSIGDEAVPAAPAP